MVVLSVGLGVAASTITLAEKLDIELNHYQFVKTDSFDPVQTSRPGIYVCGAFQAPKDIPSSVIDASAAAGKVGSRLFEARWTQTKTKETVRRRSMFDGEPPRIGVFVCCCGTNIAGFVDVPPGGGVCQNPAQCGLCRKKSFQLLPGHPRPNFPDYSRPSAEPGGGFRLHPQNP